MSKPEPAAVAIRNLSRTYLEGTKRRRVLVSLNAEFPVRAAIAIRGRSGSGKSTLLNLIAGIDTPDRGAVAVFGKDISAGDDHQRTLFRRRHIGFVHQAFNLIPTLSVADNIRLVLELNGRKPAEANQRIAELLEIIGLADRANAWPDRFSVGDPQREAVGRAVGHYEMFLLAGDCISRLDHDCAQAVMELLDSLRRQHGCTLILATHSAAAAACCDSSLRLTGGRLESAD